MERGALEGGRQRELEDRRSEASEALVLGDVIKNVQLRLISSSIARLRLCGLALFMRLMT